MTRIRTVLHDAEDHLLLAGPANNYPPVPRAGDEIIGEGRLMRLEGMSYSFQIEEVEIGLLA